MKKVNKQCLLDTPRTVRVGEKNLSSYSSNQQTLVLKRRPVESVQTKIINSFMHVFNVSTLYWQKCVYIVLAKYQIAPSKAVVGVDRPIMALSMHIQKPYKGIIV